MLEYNFIQPRTPVYSKGILVIDSDDGNVGDYIYWMPLLRRLAIKHNQWAGEKTVVMCPAVHSSLINSSNKLTVEHLQEMVGFGCEILSHGKYHTGLGTLEVSSSVSSGSNQVEIYGSGQIRVEAMYEYRLFEGETEEVVKFISPNLANNTYGTTLMTLESPLINSYTTSARVELTESSLEDLLQGCVDDLKEMGFDCFHHVYTFHSGSQHNYNQKSVDFVGKKFRSGRGTYGLVPNKKETLKTNNLVSLSPAATYEQINNALDETSSSGGLLIFYGHGEGVESVLGKLEYLIEGALSRGIRITTRTDAFNRLDII